MTRKQKEKRIKQLVSQMITQSTQSMKSKIDQALACGALDIDSWEPEHSPMITPKIIVTALLKRESCQYEGTCYEKTVKSEVRNLAYFL